MVFDSPANILNAPGANIEAKTSDCGVYSVLARSPLSLLQSPFSRSLRSTICNPGHSHPMRTLRITNGGPERAK